ncbi:hypothetical protein IAT38_001246 [Cryptococcus sp. DSM 104549]
MSQAELSPPISPPPNPSADTTPQPQPPSHTSLLRERERPPLSRPLSEISENEPRRLSNRSSVHSRKGGDKASRPVSEIIISRDKEDTAPGSAGTPTSATTKRMSSGMPLQTITVNLVEYANKAQPAPPVVSSPTGSVASGVVPSAAPSSSAKQTLPELPKRPESKQRTVSSASLKKRVEEAEEDGKEKELPSIDDDSDDRGKSPILVAQRSSLRPSIIGASYAEVAKPTPTPPPEPAPPASDETPSAPSVPPKPPTKSKPSWLRRANPVRTKSKSPASSEAGSPGSSNSPLPPTLPPRKGNKDKAPSSAGSSPSSHPQPLPVQHTGTMAPPDLPSKTSYASVASAHAGPSRSGLAEGQGRPAYAAPPPLPPRDNVGGVRGRIAAWTAAASQSSSGFSRSESSASLASQATGTSGQQRFPASAQRVLGHAGSAVSKGWAGLRSRGVGGSISNMSSLGQPSGRKDPRTSPLASKGTRMPSFEQSSGPVFEEEAVKRPAGRIDGKVFGREVVEVGKEWGVVDAGVEVKGQSEWETRRRKCLPAVVIRSVDYLHIWGPKEEGIFRISGRSSHIAMLRKEFDSGADIDLTSCHPGDLDPHAVAGLFKSYLRELPSPLLTRELGPAIEKAVGEKADKAQRDTIVATDVEIAPHEGESLRELLNQLPQAHWFLLAEVLRLLDLIPRHSATNRMTLNALMLSLGPSLNLPGGVINELMEQRDVLFSEPPPPSPIDTAHDLARDLIDFGDGVDVAPVAPPSATSSTFNLFPRGGSQSTDDVSGGSASATGSWKTKKPPRLPSRPSITKLFGASHVSIPRQKSVDTLNSIIDVETAPRVDLTMSPTSPLPTFEATSPASSSSQDAKRSTIVPTQLPSLAAVVPTSPKSAAADMEQIEEVHYAPGTVEERSKLFSTPIADRFQGTSSPFPALRAPRSSTGSASTIRSLSASVAPDTRPESTSSASNPATVIRRGPPVFFQSAGVETTRHARSMSSAGLLQGQGLKRKDEGGNGEGGEEDEGRAKRLSAGPGALDMMARSEMAA